MNKLIKSIRKFLAENISERSLTKRHFDYVIIAFAAIFGFYFNWRTQNVLMFSFVIWAILNPISSRFFARVALCFLIFVPLLLVVHRSDQAEQLAIFAYYFLILTAITTIFEFKKKQTIETRSTEKKK